MDVPLNFSCPVDHITDRQLRILLGTVEAQSVNVKNTTTQSTDQRPGYLPKTESGGLHHMYV